MSSSRIIADGDPEWWKYWKSKLKQKPIVCTIRFTFLRVIDVNEKDQEFEARVRVDCDVNAKEAFGVVPRRKSLGGGTHTNYLVETASECFEEFNPKIVLMNLKRTPFQKPSKWIRRDDETGILTFSMEVSGSYVNSSPDKHLVN
jgi:hypothetical protein